MSRKHSASKIKLNSFNDLFGTNEQIADNGEMEIKEIPLEQLHDFIGHPFQVRYDDRMEELVDSIKEYGVIVPGIARLRPQGGYEIIAGHSRKHASELAGRTTMPMFVRNLSDDEAIIVMVDSNIQREDILPSEKAKAYKMKYDAMKHQGARGNTLAAMSEESGDNAKKIQRYIWIARLSDELLHMLDEKKIGLMQGVDLSFLTYEQQQWVLDLINELHVKPSTAQTAQLKTYSQDNNLTAVIVKETLTPFKEKPAKRKVTFKSDTLDKFFTDRYSVADITGIITELLVEWKQREEAVVSKNETLPGQIDIRDYLE